MSQGRPLKFTREEFHQLWVDARSLPDLCRIADLSVPAAYAYLKRYGYAMPDKARFDKHSNIFNQFKGHMTIKKLADFMVISSSSVTNSLSFMIRKMWHNSAMPPMLPEPMSTYEIKLYHALKENEELFDDPKALHKMTGVGIRAVERYVARAYKCLQEGPKYLKKTPPTPLQQFRSEIPTIHTDPPDGKYKPKQTQPKQPMYKGKLI